MLIISGMWLIIFSLSVVSVLPASTKMHSAEISFISKIAKETTKRSGESFFHVFNFHQNFSMTPLIQKMHRNLIPTVVIEHSTDVSEYAGNRRVKNMLFLLNNCHDIVNVILDSLSKARDKKTRRQLIAGNSTGPNGDENAVPTPRLPNYCIRYDRNSVDPFGRAFGGPPSDGSPCDAEMQIDAMDLESDSMLTEEVFNLTRGLHSHEIWNGENYLVFAFFPHENHDATEMRNVEDIEITEEGEESEICETPGCNLLFVFKFIWRFFHGYRTVLCFKQQCYRYDPFYERIWEYVDEQAEYFDFSWSAMNKKPLSFLYLENEPKHPALARKFWNEVMLQAVFIMTKKLDFSLAYYGPPLEDSENETRGPADLERALKAGIDFYVLQSVLQDTDLATFDFSQAVDTGMLCFIMPRKGAVPQSVIAFKSFTLCVWLLVLVTYLSFLFLQYVYRHSRQRFLNLFGYDQDAFVAVSLLARTPNEHLFSKFFSWKLLFLTFAFSTFILITAFQTEMATLFSKRVRYTDPEKIAELQRSEHFIRAADLDLDRPSPAEDFGYSWIREWLSDFFSFSHEGLSFILERLFYLSSPSLWRNITRGNQSLSEALIFKPEPMPPEEEPNSDALVFHVPYHLQRYKNFILFDDESTAGSHFVEECVVTNPYSYPVVKYSFFTDKVNELLVRLNEAGIMQHMIRQKFIPERRALTFAADDIPDETIKSFSTADLQIAFICLVVGLIFSSGALIFETVRRFRLC